MPVRKEVLYQEGDGEYLALVFAQAVRSICFTSCDMRVNAVGEIIGEYVRENPHKDVLKRTQDLFFMTRNITQIEGFILDASEWREAIQEIKHKLSLSLLEDDLIPQKYQGDLEIFFDRLKRYGVGKLEKNHNNEE